MKRGKDEMFPRLHVNDSEEGWPRGPPRNKMALYEQLTIPSHRLQPNAVGQGFADGRGVFFSYQPEKICCQYSDLTALLRKKWDEDEFRVPNLNHSVQSGECAEYGNEMEQERVSPSNPCRVNRPSKLHKFKSTVMQEGNLTVENSDLSSIEKQADSPLDSHRRSVRSRNLERADSVYEISVMDSVAGPNTTPDDVVGIIGQKHFWKARKAILKQQRIFAVQVFELHRLVKVQKLIAESPHSLVENSAGIDKPRLLPSPAKETPNVSNQRGGHEKPTLNKESSASFSAIQYGVVTSPLNGNGNSPAPSTAGAWCFNQPQGLQWLIPVMTPLEGLVYKPYPGPGYVSPPISNPAYGIPHYQLPSFPPAGPGGYVPMPMSVQHQHMPSTRSQKNRDGTNSLHDALVVDVEILQDSRGSKYDTERANLFSLFPMASSSDSTWSSPAHSEPDLPTLAIKVVPHSARSAPESAARIFRSIQEERKQN